MEPWADVRVDDRYEQDVLERKALFFVPSAFEKLRERGLTQTSLATHASTLKSSQGRRRGANEPLPGYGIAGRAAIREVMRCAPVTYRSVRGFIYAANMALIARDSELQFDTSDIVACIFRLKSAPFVMDALGQTDMTIVRASGIKKEIVESARLRYRITYNHANSIWEYLLSVKKEKKIDNETLDILNDDKRDFIKTEVQSEHPLAVRPSFDPGSEEFTDAFVYSRRDLTPAPRSGHPWAIEPSKPAPVPTAVGRSK